MHPDTQKYLLISRRTRNTFPANTAAGYGDKCDYTKLGCDGEKSIRYSKVNVVKNGSLWDNRPGLQDV